MIPSSSKLIFLFIFSIIASLNADFLDFNPRTHIANEVSQQRLNIVNIFPQSFIPHLDPYHLFNVAIALKRLGCCQSDTLFYEKGGVSTFSNALTSKQAETFLALEHITQPTIWPRVPAQHVDIVIPGGRTSTLEKRFNSLARLKEAGYSYKKIYFIINSEHMKHGIERLIAKNCELFTECELLFLATINPLDMFYNSQPNQDYIIVSDLKTARNAELIISLYLKEESRCLGVMAAKSSDWRDDMASYDYIQTFGNQECATIAWAASIWNFIARRIHAVAQKLARDFEINLDTYTN